MAVAVCCNLALLLNAVASVVGLAWAVMVYHSMPEGGCPWAVAGLVDCIVFTTSCAAHGLICYVVM